jgi:tetratricopeptide (TPR) repeat protein
MQAVTPDASSALALAEDLVARKEYRRAAEVLRDRLDTLPRSLALRQRLADVLAFDGETTEACMLLDALGSEYARIGMPGKAIVALKKLLILEPARAADAGKRIAALAKERDLEIAQKTLLRAAERRRSPEAEAGSQPAEPSAFELADPGYNARHDEDEATAKPGPGLELPEAPPAGSVPSSRSPLFGDFSEDELEAVIRGIQLINFEPGDLIVSQGEPGDSLFVLTTGTVKVFVRDSTGRGLLRGFLSDGDFFGEVSLLTGQPRTATVIAATRCELLELGRKRLDGIVKEHPHVSEVLKRFCDERLKADEEH